MEDSIERDVVFMRELSEEDLRRYGDYVLHVMPTAGSFGFRMAHWDYNVRKGNYIIMPNPMLASDLKVSEDFKGFILFMSYPFLARFTPRSNYGVFGRIANLRNPVTPLSDDDYSRCLEDLTIISTRIRESGHLFHYERMGALVQNHVLDLYDIHARTYRRREIPKRAGEIMLSFIRMLNDGEYRKSRDLAHFASKLNIVPHYLSEICIKTSDMPASYWIETYTRNEIVRLLRDRSLSFTDIADALGFSSLSYFTRFVKKTTGMTPTEFRKK